ncbi:SRPBCC family protein [Chitinophaga sp. 22321]|uniref:SRPBCC domain-containing protein n=1 Tax=Chitinophaga hostae TaxID=2831022 RepID=A0ABS5J830_9BACT|nr:SRPBCC domain-containing protein [Chitinophaga hostae]MBS0031369.1 SRPBCC domain-containing protein [Chitinophaga hostae]
MKSICHRLLIKASPEKIYAALTLQEGLAGWWTPETTAKPETGGIARFTFGPDYFKEMKITNLEPQKKVEWVCIKAYEEWIDTTITFELDPKDKGTVLFFHHDGWKEYTPGYASCSYDWALFLRSLRLLCETGKGKPYPDFQ